MTTHGTEIVLTCIIQPDQVFTYIHLPFTVPPATARLDVAYHYAEAISSDPLQSGGNTIDIGIIDTDGAQFMTGGFRGWSGSARQDFFIALDDATPGYLPGVIQAGTWTICLGAYKIASGGCPCTVTIRVTPTDSDTSADSLKLLPVRTTSKRPQRSDHWYKGEIHCHSVHSDGDSTVGEVIAIAEAARLDFLAITDHNNRSQQIEMASSTTDLILIPGYEVTTYYGHWNIWGDGRWIDFRVQSPDDMQTAIEEAGRQGYLVSCNHPRPFGPDWAFPEVAGYGCVEVWNGPWQFLNDHCLAFWEERLRDGHRLVAVGGSDFHFSKQEHLAKLGTPTNFIYCPDVVSASNLIHHLRAGHSFISESPDGARLDLRAGAAMMGDTVISADPIVLQVAVEGGGASELQICTEVGVIARFPVSDRSQSFALTLPTDAIGYVRAQLVDPGTGQVRALTNPIFFGQAIQFRAT